MVVYIDNASIPYGRMKMLHMMADTTEELVSMAEAIGVDKKHIQYEGQPNEHFDVCGKMREKAISLGAQEVTGRDLVMLIRSRRNTGG